MAEQQSAAQFRLLPLEPTPWRDAQRAFRVTVERPCPRRRGGERPIEVGVDFPALLAKAGVSGRFDPASVRVRDRQSGAEIPYAWRTERDPECAPGAQALVWLGTEDAYDIYFDVSDNPSDAPVYPAVELPPENLLRNPSFAESDGAQPAGWQPEASELMSVTQRTGAEGLRALRVAVDESTPAEASREVSIAQTVDVAAYAGEEVVFECDLLTERAEFGAPVTIELRQFGADGSLLPTFAVQPRYLSIELAEGHRVQFRESGRFHHQAATCEVRIRFRLSLLDGDTNETVTGPEADMTVWVERVALVPVERWPWPAASHAGFVEGAFPGQTSSRAFEFTGQRRVAFNAGSESCLTMGRFNPDPRATHWGPVAGTLEFWIKPSWSTDDVRQRVLFDAKAHGHKLQSTLRKKSNGDLVFLIADSAGKYHLAKAPAPLREGCWHHVAATWDFPKAWLQVFVDGRRIAAEGPGDQPWPHSPLPESDADVKGMGITGEDKRSVPLQAFIGGDQSFKPELAAEAALDDFRVSDTVRYQADFTPTQAAFEPDEHTRALWGFEGDIHGVHSGDDEWVRGFLACERPLQRESVDLDRLVADGSVRRAAVAVKPYPPEEIFEANRAENRLPVSRPFAPPPDPRFVEFRERCVEINADGQAPARVRVEGDYPPQMRSLTFARCQGTAFVLPRWRANDNVVPFSAATLRETLAAAAPSHAEKGPLVMKYADEVTNYYNASLCESLPTLHRPRIAYTFLKMLNVYPFDQCGPLNYLLRRLFLAAGISSSNAAGTHHQFQQAFYNGHWRLFDLSARVYWLRRDNASVVSRRGLEDDLWLKLRQGGHPNAMYTGRVSEATFGQAIRPHCMDFEVRPGERAAFSWNNEGRWFELTGEREPIPMAKTPPAYGNGVIVFEPCAKGGAPVETDNMTLRSEEGGTELAADDPEQPSAFVYSAACPYIFTDATLTGAWFADRELEATVSFSADGGQRWTEVSRERGRSGLLFASLVDHVAARYEWKVKVAFSPGAVVLSALRVRSVFAASPYVHPEALRLGENTLSLAPGSRAASAKAELRWVERSKSALGVSLNALSFYLDSDRTHRNIFVAEAGESHPVTVTLQGRAAQGRLTLESLPPSWKSAEAEIALPDGSGPVSETLSLGVGDALQGEVRDFDVVFREAGGSRRVKAQVLVAASPLVREAEAPDAMEGLVAPADLAEASGARVLEFAGRGEVGYDLKAGNASGVHALWLRARWAKDSRPVFKLRLGNAVPREIRARALTGFTDWDKPHLASAKMFAHFGEQYAHWAWYRVPDVVVEPGASRLTIAADAGAAFDALLLLPQDPIMDRSAMNLFQNWNYAPWEQPL